MRPSLARPLGGLGRRPVHVVSAVALVALPVGLAGPARADSGAPSLGGYNISADGNAVDILIDNTTGLAGIHPLTEADFPEAQTNFATGPFGSGLATVFWPGSAGGNFGSLSSELGIPAQLEPFVSKANDPVKANAQFPSGPDTAAYPQGAPNGAVDMRSTADSTGTTATADIADTGSKGVLSFSSAKGTSSSVADSTARATASSDLSGVSILGGLIDIGSIQSTASATSDGTTGSGSSSTHITGVTVLGQPASIGSDGLVLPDFAKSLGPVTGPVVQELVSQTVSGLGLHITEFPSSQTKDGAGYSTTSGGVSVKIDFPASAASLLEQLGAAIAPAFPSQAAIVPTLPGLLQGMTLTVTLGRATASASASPPFDDSFNPAAGGPATGTSTDSGSAAGTAAAVSGGDTGASSSDLAGGSPSPDLATTSGGDASSSPVPGTTSAGPAATSTASGGSLPASLVSLSSPLSAGIVVLGLLIAGGLGIGLWRLARLLLPQDAGSVCPLGQDNP